MNRIETLLDTRRELVLDALMTVGFFLFGVLAMKLGLWRTFGSKEIFFSSLLLSFMWTAVRRGATSVPFENWRALPSKKRWWMIGGSLVVLPIILTAMMIGFTTIP